VNEDRSNERNLAQTRCRDWAGWLEVKLVWLRGQGYGRRLVETAEAEAPAFYQRSATTCSGRSRATPRTNRVFLSKTL
jgi:hypothetical protein